MTICVAAIGKDEKNKEFIVFSTDHMISNPAIGQFEKSFGKYKKIDDSTVAMLAGDPLIFDELIKECKKCSFDEMVKKIQKSMNDLKDSTVQKEILDIFKINYDYIKEVLKGPLQNPYMMNVIDTVSKFSLQTIILLIGFIDEAAQIVEIGETRIANLRDINFGAIGSGAIQAMNTLLFQKHSKDDPLPTTIYNVYKAKRNAEVSIGVGKETDVIVLTKSGTTEVDEDKIRVLSKLYEEELNYGKNHKDLYEAVKSIIK